VATLGIVRTDFVAVAPDDANIMVVVDGTAPAGAGAYVTVNGGSTFSSLGTIQDAAGPVVAADVFDVDVAPLSAGVRYVACPGTFNLGENDSPGLYYFNLGAAAPVWKSAVTDFAATGTNPTLGEVDEFVAVAFSPNFASDKVLTAVASERYTAAGADSADFHIISFASWKWDATAGFTNYPVLLEAGTATNAGFLVNKAAIDLAPDFLGSDDTMRVSFVGASITDTIVATASEVGGIYRLKDTSMSQIKAGTGMYSVDFDGTNLVAGASAANIVWRSADPLASTPTVLPARSFKRPGGVTNVTAAWLGADVVAATMGDESAFAVSSDNGVSFNDISLIDTMFQSFEDVYVTPDGSQTFLVTRDNGEVGAADYQGIDLSVWRKASSWTRVLSLSSADDAVPLPVDIVAHLVRGAPENNDVLYIAAKAGTGLYYTTDAGVNKWSVRAATGNILDLAVESADVAYFSAGTTVSKTVNGGFTWGSGVSAKLGGNVYTLKSIAEDQLVCGAVTGVNTVSYSTDGGSSFTKLTAGVTVPGNVQVTASGLDDGEYIYAASSGASTNVERWQIGTSTSWKSLSAPTTVVAVTYGAFGIELVDGVLYVAVKDVAPTANSAILRTLFPSIGEPAGWIWDTVASAGDTFVNTPSAFTASTGSSTTLWMIDSTTAAANVLVSYMDTLATTPVELTGPSDGFQNQMNPVQGRSVDIAFSWSKPSDNTTGYNIRIYGDAAGAELIQSYVTGTVTDSTAVVLMGPYQAAAVAPATGSQAIQYTPGETYYWKVKATAPVQSPWSEMRSFSIEPAQALVPVIGAPANGVSDVGLTPGFSWSPVAGATMYEFQLAAGPSGASFANPVASATLADTGHRPVVVLDEDTTYFWRVRAIAPVEGGWSTISNFTTMLTPEAAAPPVVIQQTPAPVIRIPAAPPAQQIVIPPAPAPPAQIAPSYIWAIIIIGAILLIVVIVLIFRTRRPV